MAVLASKNTISAIVHHHDHGATINVYFGWPIVQPKECYLLTVNGIQLVLDAHFPVRPSHLAITQQQLNDHDSLVLLEHMFGETLVHSLQQNQKSAATAVTLELSRQNRQAIARLQLDSDQSPAIIRQGCAAILGQSMNKEEQVTKPHPANSIQAFIDVFLHGDDEAEPLAA